MMDSREHIEKEKQLKRERKLLRNIMATIPDSLLTVDRGLRIKTANRSFYKLFQTRPKKVIGSKIADVLEDRDGKLSAQLARLFGTEDTLENFELHYQPEKFGKRIFNITARGTIFEEEEEEEEEEELVVIQDITERKQAEEALKESEEKYRTQFEQAMDAIVIADTETGIVIDCNRAACKLVGRKKSEIVGQHQQILHPPQEMEGELTTTFKQHLGEKEGKTLETQVITKNGEIKEVAIKANIIEFRGKKLLQGIFRDITERKQAEKALQEAKTRFEDLFETANELIITTDAEGWVLRLNKEVEKLSGYSKKELVGQSILNIAYPEDTPKYIQFWKDILSGLNPHYELRAISAENPGDIRYLLASGSAIRKDGKVVEIQYNAKDITEERQADEKLRQSEGKYRNILENITDGYYELDLAGNFIFFNDSTCKMLGYSRNELLGMNNREYEDKENVRKVYQAFTEVYTTGKPVKELEFEVIRKDGTKGFLETSASLIRDARGEPIGFRGVSRDITERKQMEAERVELEKKAQLATRLGVIGEMASGIVHEINNPLTSVIGFAEMLAQKELPEDAKEYVRIINNEGKRVAGIASRLLNFSRHQNPGRVYTDINKLIEATIELQQYEMTSGNIKITTKLDPHLPRTMADPGQMQQVFLNIMLNARTAMRLAHGGGKLLIKTKAMDNTIQISFKDDGPGIAKKNLQRIFEPFFTTRKPGEGTGLGLSICQNIIAIHDGTIYARSKLGKGATFIIKLPVVARQRKKAGNGGANHINGNPWR